MPIFDFYCELCGEEMIDVLCKIEDDIYCDKCDIPMSKRCNCTHFKLTYNNKTDLCDWEGNSSHYWDDVKRERAEGKDVKACNEK